MGRDPNKIAEPSVREFALKTEFGKRWFKDLGVKEILPMCFGCSFASLEEFESYYIDTEFGPCMLRDNQFFFGISGTGGPWVICLDDGKVLEIDSTWSEEGDLKDFIVQEFESLTSFGSFVEKN